MADAIAARMGTSVHERIRDVQAQPDHYHSDDRVWREACRLLTFDPADLDEQIDWVAAGLASKR